MVIRFADSGIGRTTVVLTAGENKSGRPRSGTVVFRASDGQECSVSVTQEAPETAGYDKWVQDHPSGTAGNQTAPEAAPSGDGIVNLMKYATGLDPLGPGKRHQRDGKGRRGWENASGSVVARQSGCNGREA